MEVRLNGVRRYSAVHWDTFDGQVRSRVQKIMRSTADVHAQLIVIYIAIACDGCLKHEVRRTRVHIQ